MRILIHDFSGHPFQVQLSRALALRGHRVRHVYSRSFQTPKGNLKKKPADPDTFDSIGISQKKPFPKYAFVKRWFAEFAYTTRLLTVTRRFRPDVVLSSNAPLDVQRRLLGLCKSNRSQFVFWLQDIYSIGMRQTLKQKLGLAGEPIALYYERLEKRLLRDSDHVVAISDDFKSLVGRWIPDQSISVIENWAPLDEITPHPKINAWSTSQGIADKFCFVYSGTLGLKHNPAILLELAKHCREYKDVVLVIVSEGIGIEWLKGEAAKERLDNFRFYGYFDFEYFPYVLSSADVLIAILKKTAGTFSVPSKVLSYHCIGRPILLSIPGENLASRIVRRVNSGIATEPDDHAGFCLAADHLLKNESMRTKMGINARNYAEKTFDIDAICNSFIQLFR